MKKAKNIIALLLVFTFVFVVIGCGKGKKVKTTATQNTETTQPVSYTASAQATNENATQTADTSVAAVTQTQIQGTDETVTNAPEPTNQSTPEATQTTTQASVKTGVGSVSYTTPSQQIVYYPAALEDSSQKYPVLAWANGTMCTPDLYTDLLKQIAEGGYIVIANFETMAADGNAQIESINLMINENSNSDSVFYNKVNTNKIGVTGHSQGGRSSVNAAVKDSRIKCVLSIAGSNFPEEAEPLKTPTLFMAGTNDKIVDPASWIIPAYEICNAPAVYASLSGAVHTTPCSDASKYSHYAIKWFDAWLKGDSNAKAIFQNGGELSKDTSWVDYACKGL